MLPGLGWVGRLPFGWQGRGEMLPRSGLPPPCVCGGLPYPSGASGLTIVQCPSALMLRVRIGVGVRLLSTISACNDGRTHGGVTGAVGEGGAVKEAIEEDLDRCSPALLLFFPSPVLNRHVWWGAAPDLFR
jgi:hypothetical protein